jgi:hypothetical protein
MSTLKCEQEGMIVIIANRVRAHQLTVIELIAATSLSSEQTVLIQLEACLVKRLAASGLTLTSPLTPAAEIKAGFSVSLDVGELVRRDSYRTFQRPR